MRSFVYNVGFLVLELLNVHLPATINREIEFNMGKSGGGIILRNARCITRTISMTFERYVFIKLLSVPLKYLKLHKSSENDSNREKNYKIGKKY